VQGAWTRWTSALGRGQGAGGQGAQSLGPGLEAGPPCQVNCARLEAVSYGLMGDQQQVVKAASDCRVQGVVDRAVRQTVRIAREAMQAAGITLHARDIIACPGWVRKACLLRCPALLC